MVGNVNFSFDHSITLYTKKQKVYAIWLFFRLEWILDYPDLQWALDDLNSLCDGEEGMYPPEVERPWVILTMPNIKADQKNEEPYAYQFTGFSNEE